MQTKNITKEQLNKYLKRYGLEERKYEFLKNFFEASVNLYGIVYFKDLLEIFRYIDVEDKELSIEMTDLLAFGKLLGKITEDILVLDINELFADEKATDDNKVVINARLLNLGYNKYETVIGVMNAQTDKPYFVPKNLMTYENDEKHKLILEIRKYLSELVVTESSFTTKWKTVIPCENVGKKLSEFDYLTEDEKLKKNLLAGKIKDGPKEDKKKLAKYLEYKKGPESEKLVRDFAYNCSAAIDYPMNAIRNIIEEIAETGVLMDDDKNLQITSLLVNLYNCSNLYVNRGWTPKNLKMELCETDEDIPSPFGPGMQKALMEDIIDVDKLIEAMRTRGWEIN